MAGKKPGGTVKAITEDGQPGSKASTSQLKFDDTRSAKSKGGGGKGGDGKSGGKGKS